MRRILLVLSALALVILSFALVACHNHEFGEWQTTKEPNCTEAGVKERICLSCGEKETEAISALTVGGHDFGEWQIDLEPTCLSLGTKSRDCKRCDEHEIANIEENKDNHASFGDWVTTKEPTCSAEGKKERVCVCEYKETAIIPKLTEGGHDFGDWAISVDPTCSAEGQRIRYCKDCNKPEAEKLSPLDEGGHSFGQWQTVTEPTCSSEGEQMRDCAYCDKKESNKIPVLTSGGHSFGDWVTTKDPTCSTEGEQKRVCGLCGNTEYEPLSPLDEGGHSYGEWDITKKPTCDSEGEQRKDCSLCDDFVTEVLEKLPIVYTIKIDIDGEESIVNLPEDGIYELTAPTKLGYNFLGFFDGDREFNLSGIVTGSKEITAKFELANTVTFNELKTRIEGGVDKVLIASDITLTDTIYVTKATEITTNGIFTLSRDASFLGDLFVLGEDANGDSSILDNTFANITIKPAEGASLTIDGNKSNITGTVTGSAFFMTSGATLNIYDGVTLSNHKKLGNSKALDLKYSFNGAITPGGSVVLINDGTFNMYGGLVIDNEVSPLLSPMTPSEEKVEGYDVSTYGGAIYNNGTINIYGGAFKGNRGSYGGAIASGRMLNVQAGLFEGNSSSYYGGALYQTNNASSVAYIGKEGKDITVIFRDNSSIIGGALRTQYNSGTVIYGSTLFDSNKAISYTVTEDVLDEITGEPTGETKEVIITDAKGGAIQSYGELIIYYAEFKGNYATERGGAISSNYSSEDKVPRVIIIHEALFENNTASLGGGIATGSDYEGDLDAELQLGKVTFIGNEASSNGGALYQTSESIITLIGESVFKNNKAGGNGGTFYLTNTTTLKMLEDASVTIEGGEAINGGVAYLKTESTISLTNATIKDNKAKSGGAIYLTSSKAILNNVTAYGNTSTGSGAVVHATLSNVDISGTSSFASNTASTHGGVIFSSGSIVNIQGTSENVITFENNLAEKQGGAMYLAANSENDTTTRSQITASFASFKSNRANQVEQYGGGALYCSNVVAQLDNLVFDSNHAIYGGAISLYSASELTGEKITFTNNTADLLGGVMYTSKSTANFTDITVNANKALGLTITEDVIDEATGEPTGEVTTTYSEGAGGAFYFNSASTAIFNILKADGNTADNGGLMMVYNDSTLEIKGEGNIIKNNQALSGEYQKGGGSIRFYDATGTIENASFEGNIGLYGGAISLFNGSEVTLNSCNFDGNKSVLYEYVTGENTYSQGGAIYNNNSGVSLDSCVIKNSSADTRGSAIYSTVGTVTLSNTTITQNTGKDSIVYLTKTTLTSTNTNYTANTTKTGVIYSNTSSVVIMNGGSMSNNEATSHGGAIYIPNGTLTADNVKFENNISGGFGGAISIDSKGAVTLNDVVFTKNIASNGGAIGLAGGSLTINGITANENQAIGTGDTVGNGGAISVKKESTDVIISINKGTTITENTFTGNIASRAGGAIFFFDSTGEFNANQLTFTNNEATSNYGGALYLRAADPSLLTADIGTIIANGNKAGGNGGALYLYKMTGSIDSITASNNSANNGGAMYIAGSAVVEINQLYGSGNSATTNGGFAYIGTSTTTIYSGEIGENDDSKGLELYVSVSKAAKIDLSKFTFPDGGVNKASYIDNIAQ